MEWQAVHRHFPHRTEWVAPVCQCSSDNMGALLFSLFTSGSLKSGLICPYDPLYDFTASYTYFHLYTYIHTYESSLNTTLQMLLIVLVLESSKTHNTKTAKVQTW